MPRQRRSSRRRDYRPRHSILALFDFSAASGITFTRIDNNMTSISVWNKNQRRSRSGRPCLQGTIDRRRPQATNDERRTTAAAATRSKRRFARSAFRESGIAASDGHRRALLLLHDAGFDTCLSGEKKKSERRRISWGAEAQHDFVAEILRAPTFHGQWPPRSRGARHAQRAHRRGQRVAAVGKC